MEKFDSKFINYPIGGYSKIRAHNSEILNSLFNEIDENDK